MQQKAAIVIGDSTNNTLSVVRSLGKCRVKQTLILVGENDFCNVKYSKYLRHADVYEICQIESAGPILRSIDESGQLLICTFDKAAMWVDENEQWLSKKFITPCRGKRIGELFNKEAQCRLARECGLTVPESVVYTRGDKFPNMQFPLLIKPLLSVGGEKNDIHICCNGVELEEALSANSTCNEFIVQQYIEKLFELDCIGVSTDSGVILSGAVRKIRHFPPSIGAGAYGKFTPITDTDIDVEGVQCFIRKSGYHGPFSVEFLHTPDNKNYFMEVNFRNEGLAYASTCAGANLHAVYAEAMVYNATKTRSCYMMNYSLDYLYVKSGDLSLKTWIRDFLRTRCFINFSLRDPMPTIRYYINKFSHR